jgi:hypothetical protein
MGIISTLFVAVISVEFGGIDSDSQADSPYHVRAGGRNRRTRYIRLEVIHGARVFLRCGVNEEDTHPGYPSAISIAHLRRIVISLPFSN